MKKLFPVAMTLVLAIVMFAGAFQAARAAEPAPTAFTMLNGEISYAKGDSPAVTMSAEEAMKLAIGDGDTISTGTETTGEIRTAYGATLMVMPETDIRFGSHNVRIRQGGIWVNFKPVKGEDGQIKFRVYTPAGTIGIRGTFFSVLVDRLSGATSVCVKEGTVYHEAEDGTKTDVPAGKKISASIVAKKLKKEVSDFDIKSDPFEGKFKKPVKKGDDIEGVRKSIKKSVKDPFGGIRGTSPRKPAGSGGDN